MVSRDLFASLSSTALVASSAKSFLEETRVLSTSRDIEDCIPFLVVDSLSNIFCFNRNITLSKFHGINSIFFYESIYSSDVNTLRSIQDSFCFFIFFTNSLTLLHHCQESNYQLTSCADNFKS